MGGNLVLLLRKNRKTLAVFPYYLRVTWLSRKRKGMNRVREH